MNKSQYNYIPFCILTNSYLTTISQPPKKKHQISKYEVDVYLIEKRKSSELSFSIKYLTCFLVHNLPIPGSTFFVFSPVFCNHVCIPPIASFLAVNEEGDINPHSNGDNAAFDAICVFAAKKHGYLYLLPFACLT